MTGVGRYKKQFKSQTTFYEQVRLTSSAPLGHVSHPQSSAD